MINQLLDLCLKDRVFNYEEKDAILEENRTRANKARALIDSVIKKGAETCEKMIGYLERKDQKLFIQLGLSSAQSGKCYYIRPWAALHIEDVLEKHTLLLQDHNFS